MEATWDYDRPGLSFNLKTGRIALFRTTLAAIDYPEYYQFMFSPEDHMFGIQPCGMYDEGAHRLRADVPKEHYYVSSMALVRFVYRTCGWDGGTTYRVAGLQRSDAIYFDLSKALEIREGKLVYAKMAVGPGARSGDS